MNTVKKIKTASLVAMLLFTLALVATLFGTKNLILASATEAGNYNKIEKIYSNATLNEDFCDSSIIVILNENASSYRGVSKLLSDYFFEDIGAKAITDLTALPNNYVNTDGSLNTKNTLALSEHLSKVAFRQILHIELEKNSKQNVLDTIKQIEKMEDIRYVGPNFFDAGNTVNPNDPSLSEQWGLVGENGIKAKEAWSITTGSENIRVGVIDSGIANHNDLKVDEGWDFHNKNDITTDDIDRHGTHVGGIIGAVGNNATGVTGVAQSVTLIPLQTINPTTRLHSEAARIAAITYARNLWGTDKQISILNHSIAGFGESTKILEAARQFPGLFVWSAGNHGNNVEPIIEVEETLPDGYTFTTKYNFNAPNIISVGATNRVGERAIFKNNQSSAYGAGVNIYAPGGSILSTIPTNEYGEMSGTSMAAPHVAGVAALMLAANPRLDGAQLKTAIMNNADTVNNFKTPAGMQTIRRLNAYRAVSSVALKMTGNTIVGLHENAAKDVRYIPIPEAFNGTAVTAIGGTAFKGQAALTEITIPGNITSIGANAFSSCTGLEAIVNEGQTPATLNSTAFSGVNKANIKVFVPTEKTQAYRDAGWSDFKIFEWIRSGSSINGITNIENLSGILRIPQSIGGSAVTRIGALQNLKCTEIVIPDSITTIAAGALSGCDSLTSITLPFVGTSSTTMGKPKFGAIFGTTSYIGGTSTDQNGDTYYIPTSLKTVVITGGETIAADAFKNCGNLTGIAIPKSVTTINKNAFSGCGNLTSIALPFVGTGATAKGNDAKFGAIFGTTTYTGGTSTDQNNVTYYIPTTLKTVAITGGKTIAADAFKNCGNLTGVTIPNSITIISASAFFGCGGLTSITLPFAGISADATGNDAKFGKIFGTASYTGGTPTDQNVVIYYIPTSLKTVTITGGITIRVDAFRNCSNLTGITISESVTSIGANAFMNCTGLNTIVNRGEIPAALSDSAFTGVTRANVTMLVPMGTVKDYEDTNWKGFKIDDGSFTTTDIGASNIRIDGINYVQTNGLVEIPRTINGRNVTEVGNGSNLFSNPANVNNVVFEDGSCVITIGNNAFAGVMCADFTIPDSVTSIGTNAFKGCIGLTSITLAPNGSLASIGNGAFEDCTGLTEVTIPGSVTTIGSSAFKGCSGLMSITLAPNGSLARIEDNAFRNCTGLTDVIIPGSVSSIGFAAFSGCVNLRSVVFMDKSQIGFNNSLSIGSYAFEGCVKLDNVRIPEYVTNIESGTFAGCTGLKNITLPEGITSIGDYAFNNCGGLTGIFIPYGVMYIGVSAFEGCSGFTDIAIPATVTSIGSHGFKNCTALKNALITSSALSIGSNAFDGCNALTSIVIPSGVTGMGSNVFANCNYLTIYAGLSSRPSGWSSGWNGSRPVIWNCTFEEFYGIPIYVTSFTKRPDNMIPESITDANAVNGISAPRREGYVFVGWYNNPDFTGAGVAAANIASAPTGTYYAKWGAETLDVTFNLNGGVGIFPATTVINGETLSKPLTEPQKSGYAFKYWALSANEAQEYNWDESVTENITLTAVWEEAYTSGLAFTLNGGGTGYEVSKESANISGSVIIPSVYNGLPVVSIASNGFTNCTGLTGITIPSGITSIGVSAFKGCGNLTAVVFGNGSQLTGIGNSAFENCGSLTDITIPSCVTSIGENAFKNCGNLTGISVPNRNAVVATNAFSGSGITNVVTLTNVYSYGILGLSDRIKLTLAFDKDPVGLNAGHITVAGSSKGALSGTGTVRTLEISSVSGGRVDVSIAGLTGAAILKSSKPIYPDTLDETEDFEIGILVRNGSDYYVDIVYALYEKYRAEGIALGVLNANDDSGKQIDQIEELLSKRVRVIAVFAIDAEALSTALLSAGETDTVVVELWDGGMESAADCIVAMDYYLAGYEQAQYLIETAGILDNDRIEIYADSYANESNNFQSYIAGIRGAMEDYGRIAELNIQIAESGEEAKEAVINNEYNYGAPKAIICYNSNYIHGITEAVSGWNGVTVMAFAYNSEGLEHVAEGTLDAVWHMGGETIAENLKQLIEKLERGEPIEHNYNFTFMKIDETNVWEYMV